MAFIDVSNVDGQMAIITKFKHKVKGLYAITLVILSAIYPILFLYAENTNEVSITQTLFPIVFSLCLATVFYFFCKLLFNNAQKQSLVTALLITIFWNFERLYALMSNGIPNYRYLYHILVVFFISLLFVPLLNKIKNKNTLDDLITILIIPISILFIFNIVKLFDFGRNTNFDNLEVSTIKTSDEELISSTLLEDNQQSYPNIYLIVLDEFASFKTIKKEFGYDVKEASFFREEGFFFAANSEVRYPYTSWSLPTLLNLDYLSGPVEKELMWKFFKGDESVQNLEVIKNLKSANTSDRLKKWNNNFLMGYLKKKGYRLEVVEGVSRYFPVNFSHVDTTISPRFIGNIDISSISPNILNSFTIELLQLSVFNLPFRYYNDAYITKHIFDYLKNNKNKSKVEPKFTLAHVVCPHTPFVFFSTGEIKPMVYNLQNKKEAYLEQYIYVLNEIKELVAEIKEQSEREIVIIIQSDHGPRPHMVNISDYSHAFSIFNAVYFSDRDYKKLYDNIGQPNTLRVVLNKYFGETFKMIEDR